MRAGDPNYDNQIKKKVLIKKAGWVGWETQDIGGRELTLVIGMYENHE